MEYTPNLNLKKPEYWDLADIEDINENMDVLDEKVENKADKTQVLTNVPAGAKFTDTIYVHPPGTNPHGTTKSDVGLGNVDNKSSATIRGEITNADVTSALGYTPLNKAGDTVSGPLTANRFIQRPSGVPTSNLGSPTVTEMALFDSQFNNKTWFYPPDMFVFEYTNDGVNWVEHSISENQIKRFVSGYVTASIQIPRGCSQYRIRIQNKNSYVYLNALYMYWSSGGNNTTVKINKKRDDGDWVAHTNSNQLVSSWPGHLYLPFNSIPWSRATTSGHYRYVEILFTPNWNHATNNITLYSLELWGGYPAGSRSLFSWDEDKNATFPAEVKATTFKKVDGTEVSYTDTITTINGKTGAISKADITALGIPAQDTVYTHPSTHSADMITDGTTNKVFTATEKTKLSGIATNANNYSHPTTAGNKHIPTGGASGQVLKYSASGTAVWGTDSDTITTINGKTGAISKADIVALGIPAQDTVYIHPTNHSPSIITQDTNNRFVTDAEKTTWNGKADLASPTFTGTPKTTANTSYTTGQLRNIRLIAEGQTVPSLSNGEIALIYSTAVMP